MKPKPGFGRPARKNPGHPLWRWLDAPRRKRSGVKFAESLGIKHQVLSMWIDGTRWIPLPMVQRIDRMTQGAVRLEDWPKVRKEKNANERRDTFWEHGKRSEGPFHGPGSAGGD